MKIWKISYSVFSVSYSLPYNNVVYMKQLRTTSSSRIFDQFSLYCIRRKRMVYFEVVQYVLEWNIMESLEWYIVDFFKTKSVSTCHENLVCFFLKIKEK